MFFPVSFFEKLAFASSPDPAVWKAAIDRRLSQSCHLDIDLEPAGNGKGTIEIKFSGSREEDRIKVVLNAENDMRLRGALSEILLASLKGALERSAIA
jgi:hypothetical protein